MLKQIKKCLWPITLTRIYGLSNVTNSPYGTLISSNISRTRCKIETLNITLDLLLVGYKAYWTAPFPMTLSDLHFHSPIAFQSRFLVQFFCHIHWYWYTDTVSGGSRIRKRGGPMLSAVGARIEAPIPPHWGRDWGQAMPPPIILFWFWISKCQLLVHSGRYFLQFSYMLYTQKTQLLGLENLLLRAHRQQKAAKQACLKL